MEKSNTSADVAAAVAATETRIEIVGERRRMRDAAFRAWVVEACLAPGARVPELARRFGICTSLIDRWRRAALEEAAAQPCAAAPALPDKARGAETPLGFVPVGVLGRAEDGGPALIARPAPAVTAAPLPGHVPRPFLAVEDRVGMIEIDLACGARLRVDAFVNERALRRVLAALRMEGRRDPGGARDQGISGLLHDGLARLAAQLRPDMADELEAAWHILQHLALVLADPAEHRAAATGARRSAAHG